MTSWLGGSPSIYKKGQPYITPMRQREIYDPNSLVSPSIYKKIHYPLNPNNADSFQLQPTSAADSFQLQPTSATDSNANSSPTLQYNTKKNLQEDIEILKNATKLKLQIEELHKNVVHNVPTSSWKEITDESKICIAVLTRGYTNNNKYYKLIERNKCIERKISSKKVDILIFHEGNITSRQQHYISTKTPSLQIRFIDITNKAFKKEKEEIKMEDDMEYRHISSFWFVDFWNFVEEYDYLLRIDEDCFVIFDPLLMIVSLKDHYFVSGGVHDNNESIAEKELNEFTLSFIKQNNTYPFAEIDYKKQGGPYTNLFGIALHVIRNDYRLYRYQEDIRCNNHIYKYNWNDVLLWEQVIHYIFGDHSLLLNKNIVYYHESNNTCINNTLYSNC
jgi:hypothetical protein